MEIEYWKRIPDYYGRYEISTQSRVRFLFKGQSEMIDQKIDIRGYYSVTIRNITTSVHQLMAITWLHHIPCGYHMVVDHIDGTRDNNNLNNLRVVRHGFNVARNRKYSSMYHNVYRSKFDDLWYTSAWANGQFHQKESFNTEQEAYDAYLGILDDNKTPKEWMEFRSHANEPWLC